MKWLKILLLIAVLLLIVDAFLGINLYRQYSSYAILDSDAIKDTIALMKKADISVSESVIGQQKPDLKLYEYDFFDDREEYYTQTAMRISGEAVAENLISHMINNGIKIISSGDTFEFYDEGVFSMMYIAAGFEGGAKEYLLDESEAEEAFISSDDLSEECGTIIEERLFPKKRNGFYVSPRLGAEIKSVYKAADADTLMIYFTQTISDIVIYGFDAEAVISGGELVAFKGSLIITGDGKSYSPTLYDQLNILFLERTEHESNSTNIEITGLEAVYTLSWNAEMTKYFMIPSWSLDYNGEYAHIRNMINGDIYLE